MISADATPVQIKTSMDRGARDYVTKPIDVSRFTDPAHYGELTSHRVGKFSGDVET